jgi:hypothetical protein
MDGWIYFEFLFFLTVKSVSHVVIILVVVVMLG